jgi:hypothetical protein
MADVLSRQAVVKASSDILHRQVGSVADDDEPFLGLHLGSIGKGDFGSLIETLAATFLNLLNALKLALGEPPSRHDQGLKW